MILKFAVLYIIIGLNFATMVTVLLKTKVDDKHYQKIVWPLFLYDMLIWPLGLTYLLIGVYTESGIWDNSAEKSRELEKMIDEMFDDIKRK